MSVDYHTQNGLNAYKTYVALRLHFTKEDYDYFRFGGTTKASMESYKKRKDAIFFEMIGKHPDPVNFMAYGFSTFDKVFPKEIATATKYKTNYLKMKTQVESMSYHLESELSHFDLRLGDLIDIDNKHFTHPPLITFYLQEKISLISLIALDKTFDLVTDYNIKDPLVWPRVARKIKKLSPFIDVNRKKVCSVIDRYVSRTEAT